MTDLNENIIHHLSRLCQIKLSQEESTHLFKDLKKVLDYMEQLKELDVDSLSLPAHLEPVQEASLREDVVGKTLPRSDFLSNAPDHVGGMVRVPTIIKQA